MSDNGTPKIFAAIVQVMKAVGAITKTRNAQMPGGTYRFRGIDDVYNALQPHLVSAGVFAVPEVTDKLVVERKSSKGNLLIYTTLTVRYTFFAEDGSSVQAVVVGEAMDSGDKSCNKAMSAAMKYAMLEVFCIPTDEPKDSENDTHELAADAEPPAPPAKPPVDLAKLKASPDWLKQFPDAAAAVAALKQSRNVTLAVEAFIAEYFDPNAVPV